MEVLGTVEFGEPDLEVVHLGDFVISSGQVTIADPCYDLTKYPDLGFTTSVENGIYDAVIICGAERYGRVHRLYALRHGVSDAILAHPESLWLKEQSAVGVDSGQMAICDSMANHSGDAKWYDMVCDITLDYDRRQSGTFDGGCASSSGYGDGLYPVYECLDKDDKAVGWCVVFIDIEEEEEF